MSISFKDRQLIEFLYPKTTPASLIERELGFHRSTLHRKYVIYFDSQLRAALILSPDRALEDSSLALSARGTAFKIVSNHSLIHLLLALSSHLQIYYL